MMHYAITINMITSTSARTINSNALLPSLPSTQCVVLRITISILNITLILTARLLVLLLIVFLVFLVLLLPFRL
jgi:hypothetical protein